MSFHHNSWASEGGKVYMQQGENKDYSQMTLGEIWKLHNIPLIYCKICKGDDHYFYDCQFRNHANSNSSWYQDDHYDSSWENQTSSYDDYSNHVSVPYYEDTNDDLNETIKQLNSRLDDMIAHIELLETQKAQQACLFEFETEKLNSSYSPIRCDICGYLDHCTSDCPFLNPNLSYKESYEMYDRWKNHQSLTVNTELLETQIAQHDCLFEFDTEKLDLENSPCDHDCFEIEPYVDIHESHFYDCEIDLSDNLFEEKVEKIEIENPSFDDNSDFDVVSFMVKSDEFDKGLKITDIDEPHFDFGDILEINDKSLVVKSDSINSFSYDSDFDSSDDELFVGKHEEIDFEEPHLDFDIDKLFDDEHEEIDKDLNIVKIDEPHHDDVLPIAIDENFDLFENLSFIDVSDVEQKDYYYDDPMLEYFNKSPSMIEGLILKKGLMILLGDKHRKIIENFDFDFYIFEKATLILIYLQLCIFELVAKIFGQRKRKKLHAIYFGTDSPASP